ncbi:MAG: alpha/beta hydrolase family protein [Bacillota bacterium]
MAAFLAAFAFMLAGCGSQASSDDSLKTVTEDVFLKNADGTYTYCEIVAPESGEPYPLVSISHGIYGAINSGGARELSEMLAESGIAAVRVDFNRCLTNDPEEALSKDRSGRTNEYTISDMLESNMLAIDFALENYNVDADRIGVYGRSFGGRIAMIMGNESWGGIDYKAMALIAPAGNEHALIHYMGGEEEWNRLREAAERDGSCTRGRLTLTPEWFEDYYKYNPALTGSKFGDKPVMVYYNTKDTVVEPKTSLDCAHAYSNVSIYEVTTDDGHGYEMSYEQSEIKDEIMDRVVTFFRENL